VLGVRVDGDVLERRPDRARPRHGLLRQERGEDLELLGEQPLVVVQGQPEQRERLGERTAAERDLRPAARDGVERREALEHADRVVGAEHGHRGTEADPAGPARDRGEHHVRRADREVRTVVLTDAEEVQADRVRELRLGHHLPDRLGLAERLAVGPERDVAEGVQREARIVAGAQHGEVHCVIIEPCSAAYCSWPPP
jgi:hypothetical protein